MKINFKAETYNQLIAEANKRNLPVARMISDILEAFTNNLNIEEKNEERAKKH